MARGARNGIVTSFPVLLVPSSGPEVYVTYHSTTNVKVTVVVDDTLSNVKRVGEHVESSKVTHYIQCTLRTAHLVFVNITFDLKTDAKLSLPLQPWLYFLSSGLRSRGGWSLRNIHAALFLLKFPMVSP